MGLTNTRIHTAELAPTQACIGGFEVVLKADRFKLMSPSTVDSYLRRKQKKGKPVQVVKGLHRYFVVDGHHTLSAILIACERTELELSVRADFSDCESADEFWERMSEDGLLYDKNLGKPVSPEDFPDSLLELQDDPFRSIAWIIRKMGAYDDLKQPYQEFLIADFLRENMPFAPVDYYEYETACVRAFELLRSTKAKKWAERHALPGVKADGKIPEALEDMYYDVLTSARHYRD